MEPESNRTLSEVMAQRKIRISDISRQTGLSRTTLTKLYYGNAANVGIGTVVKLCTLLQCDADTVLNECIAKNREVQ